jgi:hypothetical protein
MKTDDDSEEAEEPPEKLPSGLQITAPGECKENEELEWARRHVPEDYSGPRLVFRKTELHDKPPGSRLYQVATATVPGRGDRVAKELAGQIVALNDRLNAVEDRIDRAIDRLDRRLLSLEYQEVS